MDASKAKAFVAREMKDYILVSVFVAAFFLSFTTYGMYLTGTFDNAVFNYTSALVTALVLAKVILIGEAIKLGRKHEDKPLIIPTIHKAAVFTIFWIVFHGVEEGVRGLLKGESFQKMIHSIATAQAAEDTIFRAVIIFFAFIPFFALRETERIMNVDDFRLFFCHRQCPPSADPALKPARV